MKVGTKAINELKCPSGILQRQRLYWGTTAFRDRFVTPYDLFWFDEGGKTGKKVFQCARDFLSGWPKLVRSNSQRSGQAEQFKIGNPAELRFDFGERLTTEIPAPSPAPCRQHGLRQSLLAPQSADLRPDDVPRIAHVPKSELKRRKPCTGQGSEFRTVFACIIWNRLPQGSRWKGKLFAEAFLQCRGMKSTAKKVLSPICALPLQRPLLGRHSVDSRSERFEDSLKDFPAVPVLSQGQKSKRTHAKTMHLHNPNSTRSDYPCKTRRLLQRQPARWTPLASLWLCLTVIFTGVAFVMERAIAQVPQPGLAVGLNSTNQLLIVITNGVSTVNYEIYRTSILGDDANYPFTLHLIGNQGQTSFVANFGVDTLAFFRAGVGSDWDSDGVPNALDAQPNNSSVGALTITIDSPTNGAVIY